MLKLTAFLLPILPTVAHGTNTGLRANGLRTNAPSDSHWPGDEQRTTLANVKWMDMDITWENFANAPLTIEAKKTTTTILEQHQALSKDMENSKRVHQVTSYQKLAEEQCKDPAISCDTITVQSNELKRGSVGGFASTCCSNDVGGKDNGPWVAYLQNDDDPTDQWPDGVTGKSALVHEIFHQLAAPTMFRSLQEKENAKSAFNVGNMFSSVLNEAFTELLARGIVKERNKIDGNEPIKQNPNAYPGATVWVASALAGDKADEYTKHQGLWHKECDNYKNKPGNRLLKSLLALFFETSSDDAKLEEMADEIDNALFCTLAWNARKGGRIDRAVQAGYIHDPFLANTEFSTVMPTKTVNSANPEEHYDLETGTKKKKTTLE